MFIEVLFIIILAWFIIFDVKVIIRNLDVQCLCVMVMAKRQVWGFGLRSRSSGL